MVGGVGRDSAAVAGFTDSRYGFDDLFPVATLRWSAGVHNYLFYEQGGIPSGTYDPTRLANGDVGH